jgi:hypothetical protein
MSITQRSILGPVNPYDNGRAPASQVDGQQPAATGTTDQASAETQTRRTATEAAFRQAQTLAGGISNAGAAGEQIGRGPDAFRTTGTTPTDGGTGVGVSTDSGGPLTIRTDGADEGSTGAGIAIG